MAVGAPFQKSKRPFSGGDELIDEAADHIVVGLNLGGAGDAIFSGGHGLSHRVVDRAAVMPRINVVVKIADPIRPRLKIVNLHVVIGEQHLDQRLLLVQIELQRAVFVGLIPREKRIRREKEHELRIGVLLDIRQEVVLHVHLKLIGKRRLFSGVALLDAAGAKDSGKLTALYAQASDKLKAVEAEANDEEVAAIRRNLDEVNELAKASQADALAKKADELKASFIKVYLKRG